MKNRRNYYRVLHVQPDAPGEIIRSSYRAMMQKMRHHPDLGGDDGSAAEINEAYATLTNPQNREAYDKSGHFPERARATRTPQQDSDDRAYLVAVQCAFCGSPHNHETAIPRSALCATCEAPLAPAQQTTLEERGRRSIIRIAKEQPLLYCTHWPQGEPLAGLTTDISLSGMKFTTGICLPRGQVIKIDAPILKALAQVIHSRRADREWETGVQFMSLHFVRSQGSFVSERA